MQIEEIQNKSQSFDYEDEEFDIDRGIIVVVDGMAWGPFLLPEQALGWAMKHKPDMLFKLMPLLNPSIVE